MRSRHRCHRCRPIDDVVAYWQFHLTVSTSTGLFQLSRYTYADMQAFNSIHFVKKEI